MYNEEAEIVTQRIRREEETTGKELNQDGINDWQGRKTGIDSKPKMCTQTHF